MMVSSVTKTVSAGGEKIVRRLDEFPDLMQALRDGDLLTGRIFCAQLFNFDARQAAAGTGSAKDARVRLV